MSIFKNKQVRNALLIGVLSSISYFACYFARNILSVVSPQIIESTDLTVKYIGKLSTSNMLCYAIGQLINGIIGDKIKGKYLISGGLIAAGVCEIAVGLSDNKLVMLIAYSLVGFFLSMLYAPLVKIIAENTHPTYTMRCCLGLTFASVLGAPAAGVAALFFDWNIAFVICGVLLILMGVVFFFSLVVFEKRGIVTYKIVEQTKKQGGSIQILVKHGIVKFSFVSILTGIVRTSVAFWIPTYLSQYLGFSVGVAATIFTVMTCVQSTAPYINNLIIYERLLKRNLNHMVLLSFMLSTISFLCMFAIKNPFVNIVFLLLALITSSGASEMLWSVYCPSLRETGMVSSATGFLDFLSYMAAATANLLFANAIDQIGWENLILVWVALMFAGVLISLPLKFIKTLLKRQCSNGRI